MPKTGPDQALTRDEVLAVMEDRDREEFPVATASDVLELGGWDVSQRTVKNRLDTLEAAGEVHLHRAGQVPVYWLDGEKMVPPNETEPAVSEEGPPIADGYIGEAEGERKRALEALRETHRSAQVFQRQSEAFQLSLMLILTGFGTFVVADFLSGSFVHTTLRTMGVLLFYFGVLYGGWNIFTTDDPEAAEEV